MKAALIFAVLAFGGTALAARTGSLPAAAQERAHAIFSGVGVPAPDRTRSTIPAVLPSRTPSRVPATTPAPTTAGTPAPTTAGTTAPTSAAVLDLCRAWQAAREPPGKAVPAPTRKALADAAGGVSKIDEFCSVQLGEAPGSEGSESKKPKTKATGKPAKTDKTKTPGKPRESGKTKHTGKGKGKGKGKGQTPGK
jgi:hypothetical protein